MTIDELIKHLEFHLKYKDKIPDDANHSGYIKTLQAFEVALACINDYKAGYRMYTYDYSERDWLPAECELTRLLEGLER